MGGRGGAGLGWTGVPEAWRAWVRWLTGALVMGLAYIGLGELALACLVAGPVLFGSCLVIFSARSTGAARMWTDVSISRSARIFP